MASKKIPTQKPQSSQIQKPQKSAPTSTPDSIRQYAEALEAAAATLRKSIGEAPEDTWATLSVEKSKFLDEDDVMLMFDIRVLDKNGELCRTRGTRDIAKLFRDSALAEAPERLLSDFEQQVYKPVRSDFHEIVNKKHSRAELPMDIEDTLDSPTTSSNLSLTALSDD